MSKYQFTNFSFKRSGLVLTMALSNSLLAIGEPCIVNALEDIDDTTLTLQEALLIPSECNSSIIIDESLAGKTIVLDIDFVAIESHGDDRHTLTLSGPIDNLVTIQLPLDGEELFRVDAARLNLNNLKFDAQQGKRHIAVLNPQGSLYLNNIHAAGFYADTVEGGPTGAYGTVASGHNATHINIENCTFTNNRTPIFFVDDESSADINNSLFELNRNENGNGGLFANTTHTGTYDAVDNILRNNTPLNNTGTKPQIIESFDNFTRVAGQSITLDASLIFASAAENELLYSLGGLPNGIDINSNSGKISGVADEVGDFNGYIYTTFSSDAIGYTSAAPLNLSVTNETPEGLLSAPLSVVAGIPFEYDLSEYFADADEHKLKYSSFNLPGTINLNATSGILSGVATELIDFNVDVIISDNWSSIETPLSIIVNNTLPTYPELGDKTVMVGEEINWNIMDLFSDEDNHTLTISISNVPDWLNVKDGIIKGYAGDNEANNSYTINIAVSDGFSTLTPSVNLMITPKQEDDDGNDIIEGIGSLYYILMLLSSFAFYRKRWSN